MASISQMAAAKQDQRHVGLRAAVSLGYLGLGHGAFKSPDLGGFFRGQELLEARDATDVDRVLLVGTVIHPFEVGDDVIPFVPIKMIDHREIGQIGNECDGNQSMHMNGFRAAISKEIDVPIPEFVGAWSQNLTIDSSGLQPVTDAIYASDAAKITDFVEVSKVSDLNRSPFFRKSDIHVTGCPSGNGGSTIKGPSHASTFGGSAIMAAASDLYKGRHLCP